MLKNLFKLIWNKKRQNFLIMLELFISFLIMFAIFTILISYYKSYSKPVGFDYTNVWNIKRSKADVVTQSTLSRDSVIMLERLLKQQIKAMPGIQEVSFSSSNTPFANSQTSFFINYEKKRLKTNIYVVEDSYISLLNIKMQSGRWFTRDDDGSNYVPSVINEKLKQSLFGDTDPLNKLIRLGERNYKILGVVDNIKDVSDYKDAFEGFYVRADTSFYGYSNSILVKVKENSNPELESMMFKSLSRLMKDASIEIEQLDERRLNANKLELFPVIMLLIVVLFFIINVALGLFGVLWQNINKRKGEIGLRRAIGATKSDILKQMVGETILLTTLSIIAGSFFAIQFPLLNILDIASGVYITALLLAIIFIYIFVILCSLFPAKQASAIYPSEVLRAE
jgi:putative ABC transport system permease protein